MSKTPITPQIINDRLIDRLAEAMNVDIAGLTTQEIQTGMIKELGSMQTYTLDSLNTEKLVKAFFTTYNNLSKDPQFYSKPSPETGHPLKGMQGTQFDTTYGTDAYVNLEEKLVNEITVSIFKEILKERKMYLDIREFKKLPKDLNTQNNWLERHAKKLGFGSARTVFLIDSSRVLKMAFDDKGLMQNKVEAKISSNPEYQNIVARVFDVGENYHWIISELVRPIKNNKEWSSLAGVSREEFLQLLRDYAWGQHKGKDYPELLQSVIKLLKKEKLEASDIKFADQWGKTADGRVVLLDYGLDMKTKKKHY